LWHACGAPAGLVDVEQVAAEEHGVHLLLLGYLEDLAKGDEGIVLADLVLLVHAEMVVRSDKDPEE
jgi:hypothetical protein